MISSYLSEILNGFTTIKLEQAKLIDLNNRVDFKYMLNKRALSSILFDCREQYNVVEINGKAWASYNNLYYDTKNYTFYHQHHSGKLNRLKIRVRTYMETGQRFLELKFKTNKGRTNKMRLEMNSDVINNQGSDFIRDHTGLNSSELLSAILVSYDRLTLVKKDNKERITIDVNIGFTKNGKTTTMEDLAIIEIKQNAEEPSVLKNILHLHGINKDTLSKYCLGIAQLVPNIKQNLFKEKQLAIQKIIDYGHRVS